MPIQDCIQTNLPAVSADFCTPNTTFGQVPEIFIGYPNQPFTDVADLGEWTLRVNNATLADLTIIRKLHTIGSKPKPESTEIEFSQGRTLQTPKKHTLPFRVDETDAVNFAFLQFVEANPGRVYALWFTGGKYLFGGDDGVYCTLTLDLVIPENKQELQFFDGVATWEGVTPARITNPMA